MKLVTSLLILIEFLISCDPKKKVFTENNFADEKWIKPISNSTQEPLNFSDTTEISIRVSSKKIMRGFIDSKMLDEKGAFNSLVEILDDFKNTPHNPSTVKNILFFDGSHNGSIMKTTSENQDFFNPNNYIAGENNLHTQFKEIAKEIVQSHNKNKFHVILSDGETTIRKFQGSNTSELSEIRNAVKDILIKQPNTCIGVISLLANFKGNYNYTPDSSKAIECKRYLYAFCFFDKSFMPEFQRFASDALKAKGSAFLFNTDIPTAAISSSFIVYPQNNGSTNKSSSSTLAAYSFPQNLADSIVIENTVADFNVINLSNLVYKVYYRKPDDAFHVTKEKQEVLKSYCRFDKSKNKFITSLRLTKTMSTGIYQLETTPVYDIPAENIVGSIINTQDISDNTINEVKNIGPADTLRTEGLRDLYEVIFKALNDVEPLPVHVSYISIINKK